MKNKSIITCTLALAPLIGFIGCDVEQTKSAEMPEVDVEGDSGNLPEYEVVQKEEGEMPSVDVDVEGGQLPEYDVETADIDVGATTETMEVPKVKLVVEEEEFEVPYIDVDMPDAGGDTKAGKQRTSILASVETPNPGYALKIQRVYIMDDEIAVISELTEDDIQEADGEGVASDGLVINTQEMEINHYVITSVEDVDGRKGDYSFASSLSEFDQDFSEGKLVYDSNKQKQG